MSIVKKLADVRVEEGSPVTLECEFSRQNVEVKWLKVKENTKNTEGTTNQAQHKKQNGSQPV